MGGTTKSSKIDQFSMETPGDLGIPHDLRTPHMFHGIPWIFFWDMSGVINS